MLSLVSCLALAMGTVRRVLGRDEQVIAAAGGIALCELEYQSEAEAAALLDASLRRAYSDGKLGLGKPLSPEALALLWPHAMSAELRAWRDAAKEKRGQDAAARAADAKAKVAAEQHAAEQTARAAADAKALEDELARQQAEASQANVPADAVPSPAAEAPKPARPAKAQPAGS